MSVYKQYFERRNPELRSFTCTLRSILSRPGSWLKEKMWIWQALYRLSGARSIYHGQIIEGLKSIYMQMEYWITNQSLKNSFQEFWELQDLLLSQFLLPLLVTKKKKKIFSHRQIYWDFTEFFWSSFQIPHLFSKRV